MRPPPSSTTTSSLCAARRRRDVARARGQLLELDEVCACFVKLMFVCVTPANRPHSSTYIHFDGLPRHTVWPKTHHQCSCASVPSSRFFGVKTHKTPAMFAAAAPVSPIEPAAAAGVAAAGPRPRADENSSDRHGINSPHRMCLLGTRACSRTAHAWCVSYVRAHVASVFFTRMKEVTAVAVWCRVERAIAGGF